MHYIKNMTKPTAFRFDDVTDAMIDQLAASLGMTRTGVIRHAVRKLHRAEGLPEPKAAKKGGQ